MGKQSRRKRERRAAGAQVAAEALRGLQVANPPKIYPRTLSARQVLDVAKRMGVEVSHLPGLQPVNSADLAQIALGRLRARLSSEHAAFLPPLEQVAVGLLGDVQANASATTFRDGQWLITMNDGLPFLFYETARALSLKVVYSDGSLPPPPTDPTHSAALITEVVRHVVGLGSPGGWDYPVDPARLMFANLLAMNAEMFVIAHEVSHLLLGHPEMTIPTGPDGAPILRQNELDADAVSWRLVTNETLEAGDLEQFRLEFAAADFALRVLRMVASAGGGGREPGSATHPPIGLRLRLLHEWGRSLCANEESFEVLTAIPTVFDEALQEAVAPFARA